MTFSVVAVTRGALLDHARVLGWPAIPYRGGTLAGERAWRQEPFPWAIDRREAENALRALERR